MSKRKYNKGFHFNNNPRGLDLAKVKNKETIKVVEQENIENITLRNEVIAPVQKNIAIENNFVAEHNNVAS